jgi:hypothetical protein
MLTSSITPLYQSPPVLLAPTVRRALLLMLPTVVFFVNVALSTTRLTELVRLMHWMWCHLLSASTGPLLIVAVADDPRNWQ